MGWGLGRGCAALGIGRGPRSLRAGVCGVSGRGGGRFPGRFRESRGFRSGSRETGGRYGTGDPGKGALFRNGSRAERRGGGFSMGEIATPKPKPGAAAEALLRWSTDHLGNAREPPSSGREQRPRVLNPQPENRNAHHPTPNPQPPIHDPQPSTRNREPGTLNPEPAAGESGSKGQAEGLVPSVQGGWVWALAFKVEGFGAERQGSGFGG